jgi:primase-polymerase (primpol)-like protein
MQRDALDELAERRQWIYWKFEPPRTPGGKPVKMPYAPISGRRASTTDSHTWSTFDDAVAACQAQRGSGIGFVFSADDPYCGVDLDACIDRETGEVAAWATAIVDAFASYTEFSPSGTGLHIIGRGSVPPGGNRQGAIELYSVARYFTMTGRPYPGCSPTIRGVQKPLDALHRELFHTDDLTMERRPVRTRTTVEGDDAALLSRMFASRNGDQIRRLWDGNTGRYYSTDLGRDDLNRADMALAGHLSYWTGGDKARADRLFRQSALFRDKWDAQRGKTTYGERTLSRVGHRVRVERGPIEL